MTELTTHFYRVGSAPFAQGGAPTDPEKHRREIEPWLSAVFQSEHLGLLVGNGFTTAVALSAGAGAVSMGAVAFGCELEDKVNQRAAESSRAIGREEPNIEDQLRAALQLVGGLDVLGDARADEWRSALNGVLRELMGSVLDTERAISEAIAGGNEMGASATNDLISFLLSFASRAASRERLQIFSTNYDRLLEFGFDLVGLRPLDRFVGGLEPVFRSSRLDVDMHYNPPGIRGEPRYLEGVVRLTKLHGSLDWAYEGEVIRRVGLPFGASRTHPAIPAAPLESVIIYPNPAKDIETLEYPYAELFRDYSAALCRPNSTLVTYGYGFGDDHINRVIADMLTIPSTHLVIISFDACAGRIESFLERVTRDAQVSMLIGPHFGDLPTLVKHYLPKPAIDTITFKKADLVRRREQTHVQAPVDDDEVASS